ncbi:lysozyme inhibitor LprI family protein [Notoacmeibacter sp. MSK16QG-6]|uniref:lysozyme inhibitor LprI family protein n=1 Tax=Notoacmeibacter sp. MSK16QG-6 TaxID=2957982 RepID=UPI00209D6CF2|nr:lysozyme inhibitor LprI family protein [Notoacmeibacter sp. MSK16QG-6]MCP1200408.1 lysozyme inhibitor LprI family protein [Notoacmeibacter sp. MSK16QG-6]
MRRLLCPATALMAATVGLAKAQPAEPNCADPQTQMEMTACAAQDYEAADDELNALWPDMIANTRSRDADMGSFFEERGLPTTEEILRAAQRAWIAYRDAECDYQAYDALGGTMQPMLGSECRARLTAERVSQWRQELSERQSR